jgi:hypothetical protein
MIVKISSINWKRQLEIQVVIQKVGEEVLKVVGQEVKGQESWVGHGRAEKKHFVKRNQTL